MGKVYDRMYKFFEELSAELKLRGFLEKKLSDKDKGLAVYSSNNKELWVSLWVSCQEGSEKTVGAMVDFKKDRSVIGQMPGRPEIRDHNYFSKSEYTLWYRIPYEILINKITDMVDVCKYF